MPDRACRTVLPFFPSLRTSVSQCNPISPPCGHTVICRALSSDRRPRSRTQEAVFLLVYHGPDLRQIRLPQWVRIHLCALFCALLQAVVSPEVDDLVQGAEFSGEVAEQVRQQTGLDGLPFRLVKLKEPVGEF